MSRSINQHHAKVTDPYYDGDGLHGTRLRSLSADEQIKEQSMARGEVNPIQVWRFHQAPVAYQKLSEHGGDEVWLAFVPDVYDDLWMPWLDKISYCVSEHKVAGGTVRIGAHA